MSHFHDSLRVQSRLLACRLSLRFVVILISDQLLLIVYEKLDLLYLQ